jgi:hypothetical protein
MQYAAIVALVHRVAIRPQTLDEGSIEVSIGAKAAIEP